MSFVKRKDAKTPFRDRTTCLCTRSDQISEGRCFSAVGRFSFSYSSMNENGVARAFAERAREGPCHAFLGRSDARTVPPRRAPRAKNGGFSQNG